MTLHRCCFTGHRQLAPHTQQALHLHLDTTIAALYEMGCREFYAGGAMGFDTLAAERVLLFRQSHPDVMLILLLPCRDQCARWPQADIQRFQHVLAQCDQYRYIQEFYSPTAMRERNMALVHNSDVCVAFVTHPRSGTGQTVRAAKDAGIPILNLADHLRPEEL